jgi:hypothetical protein
MVNQAGESLGQRIRSIGWRTSEALPDRLTIRETRIKSSCPDSKVGPTPLVGALKPI